METLGYLRSRGLRMRAAKSLFDAADTRLPVLRPALAAVAIAAPSAGLMNAEEVSVSSTREKKL
jgi:hypothetical protein